MTFCALKKSSLLLRQSFVYYNSHISDWWKPKAEKRYNKLKSDNRLIIKEYKVTLKSGDVLIGTVTKNLDTFTEKEFIEVDTLFFCIGICASLCIFVGLLSKNFLSLIQSSN